MNELRCNGSALCVNDRQTITLHSDGKRAACQRTAAFGYKLGDFDLFNCGQFFDLRNDFRGTHTLIIRLNRLLASSSELPVAKYPALPFLPLAGVHFLA